VPSPLQRCEIDRRSTDFSGFHTSVKPSLTRKFIHQNRVTRATRSERASERARERERERGRGKKTKNIRGHAPRKTSFRSLSKCTLRVRAYARITRLLDAVAAASIRLEISSEISIMVSVPRQLCGSICRFIDNSLTRKWIGQSALTGIMTILSRFGPPAVAIYCRPIRNCDRSAIAANN